MTSRSAAPTVAAETTELFVALRSVVKKLRHHPHGESLRAVFQGVNLAPRHVAALVHVAIEGPIGMTDLAERLSVSLATVSQVVTELADAGLVERSTDEQDRRRTYVSVARPHAATIRTLLDSRLQPLDRTLHRLEPAERGGFVRGLTVLAEELDQAYGGNR